jgi:hypothetical protein
MTPILFLLVFSVGLILTVLRHPIYGVYTYLFTFYMSPDHAWWADLVPDLRYQFIIGALTAFLTFFQPKDPNRPPWISYASSKLFVALVAWMWVQYFWAVNQDVHLEGTVEFSKHLLIYFIIYRLFDTEEKIRNFLLAHITGCFWFGYLALDASSGRLESIGGPVGGSNELGVHVTTALIVGGIMWLYLRGWARMLVFAALPFIVNTIVLTVSRGAFLGLFAAGGAAGVCIPKQFRVRFAWLSVLAMVLLALLAHQTLIDRFVETWEGLTGDQQELDSSAQSRGPIFQAGMRIGQDYPLGAGYRGTAVLSPMYIDDQYLDEDTGQRSAHNTFAAVFAEHGYPGAILYVLLVLWVIKTVVSARHCPGLGPNGRALLVALAASVVGVYVSGLFSNNLFTETQYWYLALICSQLALASQAADAAVPAEPSRETRTARFESPMPGQTRALG